MKHVLVVVDIQKDFVDGALGTAEAVAMVDNAAKKISEFDGAIFVTYDTHFENYMDTAEGAKLPVPHCIKGTAGWELNEAIAKALAGKNICRLRRSPLAPLRFQSLWRKRWATKISISHLSDFVPIFVWYPTP